MRASIKDVVTVKLISNVRWSCKAFCVY